MGKKVKCRMTFHGSTREIDMGEFSSIAEAKRYAAECWDRPYSIRRIKPATDISKILNNQT